MSRLEKAAKGREGSYTSLVYTAQCPLFIHGRLLKYIEGDAVAGFVYYYSALNRVKENYIQAARSAWNLLQLDLKLFFLCKLLQKLGVLSSGCRCFGVF